MKHTIRVILQTVAFIASVYIVVSATRFIAHQYCPYAVVCFGAAGLRPGGFFLFVEAIIAGLVILLSVIFIGRRFCGYLCPFGTISEYLNYLNPVRKKMRQIPPQIEKRIRIGKYLLLLFNLVAVVIFANRVYDNACPIMTITSLSQPNILIPGITFLVLIFLANILIVRFWCRYLCPYAALMNCFQFAGKLLKIKKQIIHRNLETCIDCYKCNNNCQMNIDLLDKEQVEDFNCIYCLKCIKVCPKEHTLCVKL